MYWEVLALNKSWRIRETMFFEIGPSYTNMIPMMIPFFPSIPYVILKKYVKPLQSFFLYFHCWFKVTSFYTKFWFWEQEEVCGERLGLYSGCESNGVLFSAKSPRKILGFFTLDDETSALFLNILYLDNTKKNVLLHISMAKVVMWMCHNLNIICTLSGYFFPHINVPFFMCIRSHEKRPSGGHVCIFASINLAPTGWTFMKFDIGGFY